MRKNMGRLLQRFSAAVVNWRWALLVLSILATTAMVVGTGKLSFSTDYRVYFGANNPQLLAFEQLQNSYNKNDITLFVIEPPGDNAFNVQTLSLARELTDLAWQLPYVMRVDSPNNFQHTEAQGDDLSVADLVPTDVELTEQDLQRISAIATQEPLLRNRLVAADGGVIAVASTHQFPGETIAELPETVTATRELKQQLLEKYPDHRIYLSGVNMLNTAFTESSQVDMSTLYPAMYVLLLVVLYALLRSIAATFASLIVIVFSTGAAMGLAGHFGIGLTSPSTIAPVVITALAVADAVHLLITMFAQLREGQDKHSAIVEAVRLNFVPIMLTSVTTAMGLLTLNFADSPPLRDLGNISAMGAILAWVFSIVLLPGLVMMLPVKPPPARKSFMAEKMEAFAHWLIARQKPVLIVSAASCIGLMALVPLNEPNDLFAEYFDHRVEFRNDTDFMVENLTGLYSIEFSLPAPNGVSDPAYLAALEKFKQYWLLDPRVRQISSVSDIFKRLNKNMHGDDPAWYKLPEEADLAAQYLLLYEFSLPFGLDLTNTINLDKSASRFIVVFDHLKSAETRKIAADAEAWLQTNMPEQFSHAVSPPVMFAFIAERNFLSMAKGIPLALIGISLLLILALGSLRFGLISLVPNLFPLGMAFGVWALINGEINFAMSFAMGVVLGVIVDDTIHFMSKYLRARRELGLSPEQAIVYSFRTVGTALIVTSVVLAAGFLVLSYSAFYPASSMSILTMIAIVAALAVDFLLLPVLLLKFDNEPISNPSISAAPTKDETNETAYA